MASCVASLFRQSLFRSLVRRYDHSNLGLTSLIFRMSIQGLGEEYADDFVRQKTGNVVEDKDEATRRECRVLLKTLFAKLDALSHFHFAPKPIIKEMAVQKEVPALAMEEVAPQVGLSA